MRRGISTLAAMLCVLALAACAAPAETSGVPVPETVVQEVPVFPELEETDWAVACVEPEEFGIQGGLDNPAFEEVFQYTETVPLDKLIAFLLEADALSEGASDELYHRFLEAPHTVLTYLALLDGQTVELGGLGKVSVAEFMCRDIACADAAWYGGTEEFVQTVADCREAYPAGGRVAVLLDCLEEEHAAAMERNG